MNPWSPLRKRKTPKAAVFTDQLQRLIEQGVPEVEAVDALVRDMPKTGLRQITREVSDRLKSGQSLSASLSGFPRHFPDGYLSIIEAGEKSGDLPQALALASTYVKRQDVSKQRIFLGILLPVATTVIFFSALKFFQDLMLPRLQALMSGFSHDSAALAPPPPPGAPQAPAWPPPSPSP